MTAIANDFWQEQADEPELRIDGKVDPQAEDRYWQTVYWAQANARAELDYEDYAPAYCVGYCGFAQYGGAFDDAEKSLIANWVRIKGDSRLTLDQAMHAIRAAWDHAAGNEIEEADGAELVDIGTLANAHAAGRGQRDYAAA
jgi:hypothetical protein